MGLLDGLYSGQSGGGLLDFLRNNAMNQQFGSGLQSDQAQYGAPMGAMAQMPQASAPSAPMPQAAPPQPAPQAPQQPQEPGFGDRLMAGFQNFANARGPLQALAGGVQGLATGNAQANQTAQFLVSKGIDPAMAKTIVSDPVMLRAVLPQVMGMGGQTDDIKEYQFAKKEDPSLTFQKFMSQKKAVSGEFGMQPIWGTGPDGKPAVLQLGKSGEAKQSVLPPGFNLARDPIKVEGPTGTTILDPQTRQQVGFIPKDNAKKEADEKIGQARGTAQAALNNGADIDAQETIKKIDQFVSNKGFNEVFGQLDQYRPKWSHSDAGTDALARYEQLTGVSFLSAYQMLKGGGAITDIEGQKAGAAMARLNRAQSEDAAKQALADFKDAVETGLKKLKRAANGGEEPAAPTAAPKRIRLNADGTIAQ
jgi:hypothetical protein